ncbi:ATP-dependent DNA ligase [Streptomyces sp. V1I6]|nr:ATP-dependent DNA ligase [Streptomyces sp. V1I6]
MPSVGDARPVNTPQPLRPPLPVALASIVRTLPRGPGLAYEPKLDGIRMLLFRLDDGVVLQTRRNNIVTSNWSDLVHAAQALPVGTVLDGEAVIWREGRMDFPAVLQRASSSAARAAQLVAQHPASYGAFDILATEAGDVRSLPYERRRLLLEQVLANVGPPLQPVLVTRDPDEAQLWHDLLPEAAGTEGLVIKRLNQSYPRREQRVWSKLRHTETSDAAVVGFTGRPDRPAALVLQLADRTRPAVTASLSTALRLQIAPVLPALAEPAQAWIGETQYTRVRPGLVAEVEEGTTRHAVIPRVVRLRADV